ncbi:MAG: class II aldolase/adducin family protein [Bacteroidales bacterium]|nr:class II aldolase/adducin family protein [Bacteroidales bacterium]
MAEQYSGIKYKYIEKQSSSPNHNNLHKLKEWCNIFFEKNFAPAYSGGSSGNLSFRSKPGSNLFIITCSHTALSKKMLNSDFSEVTECILEEKIITATGIKPPSSESFMHYLIYKNFPEINAVFHGHSKEIMNKAKQLNLPVTEKELPYGTVELAKSAVNILKTGKFAVLKNHGFISIGKSMKEAGQILLNL